MTFYEAAVEVLKSASRPLHYKKITELAIKRQLLSHIGKTPEVTMGTRLVQEVQRATDTSEIVRTRPGVYALRIWETEPPTAAADEPQAAPATDDGGDTAEGRRQRRRRRSDGGEPGHNGRHAASAEPARDEPAPFSPADLYGEGGLFEEEAEPDDEEGTDEGPEDEAELGAEGAEGAVSSRRRRRRRRRRRGGGEDEARTDEREPRADEREHRPEPQAAAAPRPERVEPVERAAAPRVEVREPAAPAPEPRAVAVPPARDMLPGQRDLPATGDAASMAAGSLEVLRGAGSPLDADRILQALGAGPGGRVSAATLAAALVTDNRVRESRGLRPHFVRLDDTRWGLTEWSLEQGVLRIEEHLQDAVHHLRRQTVEQLALKLRELTVDTWQHLVLALLKHIGYSVLGIRRRDERTFVVRAEHRVGLSTVYVAIELCDCDELRADAVTELRGTLHHHGSSRGVIFTTGLVSEAALEESRIANLPPITLIGRDELAQMLVDAGIGVHKLEIPVYYVDHGFFERLSGR